MQTEIFLCKHFLSTRNTNMVAVKIYRVIYTLSQRHVDAGSNLAFFFYDMPA